MDEQLLLASCLDPANQKDGQNWLAGIIDEPELDQGSPWPVVLCCFVATDATHCLENLSKCSHLYLGIDTI